MRKLDFKDYLGCLVVSIVLLGMMATQASALDLTGTWVGKQHWHGFNGQTFSDLKKDVTLAITQVGNYLSLDVNGTHWNGLVIEDARKPERKGEILFIDCDTTTDLIADRENQIWNAMGRAKVRINKQTAMIETTSIIGGEDVAGFNWVVTIDSKYTRVDTQDPGVPPCP
ncbi:MAG: hypothetical protein SWH78_18120 [Thermodesulfobacteriota bacterium]|nr:hypothetical protein [Thermodesulfobacteriota bacterium]